MYESYLPRTMLTNPPQFDSSKTNPLADPTQPSGTDPVNGRECITDQEAVPVRRIGTTAATSYPVDIGNTRARSSFSTPRDCTLPQNNAYACDCPNQNNGALNHPQTPPVCDDSNPTIQVAAKAYLTIRELQLAKMMGTQGIVDRVLPRARGRQCHGRRSPVRISSYRFAPGRTTQDRPNRFVSGKKVRDRFGEIRSTAKSERTLRRVR